MPADSKTHEVNTEESAAARDGAGLRFEVVEQSGAARLGRLHTPHGVVETPAFMVVGTRGAVKGLEPQRLERLGAPILLANLFHLALRPGIDTIEELGGLHAFAGWRRSILTDSGGYQVWSLASLRQVDQEGVTFRSPYDGQQVRLDPPAVVAMQERLGVDMAMCLDECPRWPIGFSEASESLARTQHWAALSRRSWKGSGGGLFGIVQGSFFPELRRRAVDQLTDLDFDGYAIGGVSVGEGRELGQEVIGQVAPRLPVDRPRYLMGLGTPHDLAFGVSRGIDLFDCVLPTRNARHGHLYTRQGVVKIKNARYRRDPRPIDPDCPHDEGPSRAFLHHLFRCGEVTAQVLATAHNIRFYLDFMADLRQALRSGSLLETVREAARRYPA